MKTQELEFQSWVDQYFPGEELVSTWIDEQRKSIRTALHYILDVMKKNRDLHQIEEVVDSISTDKAWREHRLLEVYIEGVGQVNLIETTGMPDSYFLSQQDIDEVLDLIGYEEDES